MIWPIETVSCTLDSFLMSTWNAVQKGTGLQTMEWLLVTPSRTLWCESSLFLHYLLACMHACSVSDIGLTLPTFADNALRNADDA